MAIITVALSQLKRGDVVANTDGGECFTVAGVQVIGPVVIVDFLDGTATPPIPNGLVDVIRPD